ncbi:MAG: hypothetical protein J3K34DRAFT_524810 [Monoraphidium minutum]|nr:MAG: hypothetical protein J3K34DRAFT_524810 [Monoraphidium minutum]
MACELAAAPRRHARGVCAAASPLQQLTDLLLNRAASRLERGKATCITCKGSGACTCDACKGQGTLRGGAGQASSLGEKAQNLFKPAREKDWLVTNRCLRCHGRGSWVCRDCGGTGFREPPPKPAARK